MLKALLEVREYSSKLSEFPFLVELTVERSVALGSGASVRILEVPL